MLLKNKSAVIYGAGGAVGGAIAQVFAREGARVFLTGRTKGPLDALVREIVAAGGQAEAAQVDALDERAVEGHIAGLVEKVGKIGVSFNAITAVQQPGSQGIPLAELPVDNFTAPITAYLRSHFLTARAAARRMVAQKSGVILMHTPEPARLGATLVGGMGPAWAAMEAFNRNLSAEFGPHGIRAICLRSTGMPETATIDVVFGLHGKAMGISPKQFQGFIESMTLRRRSTALSEVAEAAAFFASDRASAMTGTVANLTGGIIVD
jgi:NAD(P)-dependent dehydrogenase (short-subunit alcohol dehydrogenase family)